MKKSFRWGILPLLLFAFSFQSFGQASTIWVPVKINILRQSNGTIHTPFYEITHKNINNALAYANKKFKNANVQFFIYGNNWDENTIDRSDLYSKEYYLFERTPSKKDKEIALNVRNLTNWRDVNNALNVYIIPFHGDGVSGSAQRPIADKLDNTHILLQGLSDNYMEEFKYLFTHELGHSFGLLHTFEGNWLNGKEKIDGSNCLSKGDKICDTPADPDSGSDTTKRKKIIESMIRYGKYSGYTPDLKNIMSYYYSAKNISNNNSQAVWNKYFSNDLFRFTPQQMLRIGSYAFFRQAGVTTNFNYLPTAQSPATITSLNLLSNAVSIQWTHNSSSETGYFIERATNLSPTSFVCIGGVAPNIFSFPDNPPLNGVTTLYYRIIPSNAKGVSAYSNVMSINIANNIKFGQTVPLDNISLDKNTPKSTSTIIDVCKNTSFDVEFSAEGAYNSNNLFRVQLSDQSGNFGTNPLVIGSGTTSPISAMIPNQSFPSGSYKIRIVSTNPVATSSASSDTYNIYPSLSSPTLSAVPTSVSYGNATLLSASGCNGTVNWSFNKTGSVQSVRPTTTTTYTAYCKAICKSDDASIAITVTNLPATNDNINYIEYFFDADPGFGNGTPVSVSLSPLVETVIPASVSGLSQGVHILNVRVRTGNNKWSVTHTQPIMVHGTGASNNIVKFEYFYDSDPGFEQGIQVSVSPDSSIVLEGGFSTNDLSQGLHNLFVRAKDGANRWSTTQQTPIMVIGTGSGYGNLAALEYFIDTDPGVGSGTAVSVQPRNDATTYFNVNLNSVSDGVHVLYVRVKDDSNRWSTLQSQVFVKIPNSITNQIVQAEYYIDTDPGQGNATAISFSPNPSQEIFGSININASLLTKGTHTIYVRAKDSANLWSSIVSKTFEVESTPCPPVENIVTPTPAGTTQAMERIFSISKVENNTNANYRAGNSVLLSPGFETKSNVSFKITIEGCVND